MANLSQIEKAYILAYRGQAVPIENATSLESMLGNVTPEEEIAIVEWQTVAVQKIDTCVWRVSENKYLPDTKIIARALALHTGHQCLIPISYFTAKRSASIQDLPQRLLLAYYERRGYPTFPPVVVLTSEQRAIADLGNAGPFADPIFCVVRAGPGTGKSTTAVELTKTIVSNGNRVLLVAYTNSATTTLRRKIAADPFMGNKYTDDPFSSRGMSKTSLNPILLSTVDQLASAIKAGKAGTRSYGNTVDFERTVSDALTIVRNDKRSLDIFLENGQVPVFDYLIVDEGQMLTDDRADLAVEIARGMCRSGINGKRSCHIIIFNDPKQAISEGAGKWLIKLYENAQGSVGTCSRGIRWQLHSLHYTYRFKTTAMLEYVMKVSRTRPSLHDELIIHESAGIIGPEVDPRLRHPARARSIDRIEEIVAEISQLYSETRSVAILTPTYGRTNAVSLQLSALILEMQKKRVPMCLHEDSKFKASGVVITTFNSCAGMEFSHVFIIGAAGYPRSYPQVSYEVGRSLMFVANSRARLSLCYLLHKPELCVDVSLDSVLPLLDAGVGAYAVPDKYVPRYPKCWTAETMIFPGGPVTYLENNGIVASKFITRSVHLPKCETTTYEMHRAFGDPPAILRDAREGGSADQMVPSMAHACGLASYGRKVVGRNGQSSECSLAPPPQGSSEREAFYWYTNKRPEPENQSDRTNAIRLREALELAILHCGGDDARLTKSLSFCRQMTKLPSYVHHDTSISDCFAIAPDIMFTLNGREGFVIITDQHYHALYIGGVIWSATRLKPLIAQVDTKGSIFVYDGFHELVGYHLDPLRRIHKYAISTIFKDNYLGTPETKRPGNDLYAIDTEYVNGKDLYEIGIVCLSNPYASLTTPLRASRGDPSKLPDGARIQKMGLTQEAYDKIAITTDDLLMRFMEAVGRNRVNLPHLLYFSASPDVDWIRDTGVQITDIAAVGAKFTPKRGVFESDQRRTELNDIYGMLIGPVPKERRHSAFPDAIMLAEVAKVMILEDVF